MLTVFVIVHIVKHFSCKQLNVLLKNSGRQKIELEGKYGHCIHLIARNVNLGEYCAALRRLFQIS